MKYVWSALALAAMTVVTSPVLAQDADPQVVLNQRTLQGCFFDENHNAVNLSLTLDQLKYRSGSAHQIWVKPETHKLVKSVAPNGRITCNKGVSPNYAGVAVIGGGNQGSTDVLCDYKYPNASNPSYTASATLAHNDNASECE